jgi:RNA polymerase sigma-70 factor (ECF subfamily)
MYKKEEVLTINFMIERIIQTHFSDRVKPEERNEVRQEVIDKILTKRLRHSDTKGNLGKWLYRVIQNHLTDNYRIKKRRMEQFVDDLSYHASVGDENDHLSEELHTDRMTQYNHLLSEERLMDQTIVRLRHEEGMSYEQIAEKLATPKGRLAMRYKRVKERMRRNYRPNRILE